MSIENDLRHINEHLSRIAAALEGLLSEHGHVPTSPTTVKQPELDLDEDPKPAKKKKSKKKAKKPIKVGKQDADNRDTPTLPDVRAKLHELQEAESQAAVKSLLKSYGASTLGQVDEEHYQRIIDTIDEAIE